MLPIERAIPRQEPNGGLSDRHVAILRRNNEAEVTARTHGSERLSSTEARKGKQEDSADSYLYLPALGGERRVFASLVVAAASSP